MCKVDPKLRQTWLKQADESVDLIVRVEGDVRQRSADLEKRGVEVRRHFRLVGSVSIRCKGKMAVKLLDVPWVRCIEPDRTVKALT